MKRLLAKESFDSPPVTNVAVVVLELRPLLLAPWAEPLTGSLSALHVTSSGVHFSDQG